MLPQSPTRKLLALLLALVVCWQLFVLWPSYAPPRHDALDGVIESFLAELQPLILLPDSGRLKHGLRARLRCGLAASEPARYAGLKQQSIFVASNLVNAAFCLPSFAVMLLRMTAYLDLSRLTVSIYENDSGDATPAVLQALEKALVQAGVKMVIIQSAESDRAERHWQQRIQTMAKLRNEALRPLYENTTGIQYDSVLFLNDVFTCEADALELLYQRKLQDAEQVCATDWNYTPASGGTKLYDVSWPCADRCIAHLMPALGAPRPERQPAVPLQFLEQHLPILDDQGFRSADWPLLNSGQRASGPMAPWPSVCRAMAAVKDLMGSTECPSTHAGTA
jgi:hypothetical protein